MRRPANLSIAGVLLLIALMVFAAGCPKQPRVPQEPGEDAPVRGDTLIVGSLSPVTLNPVLSTDTPSSRIIGLVFSSLVRGNDRLEFEGDLARDWTVSADGLVWTFHLRDDVRWHDGTPFTAHDVAFTLETIRDPHTVTVRRGDFEQVEKWEVVDPHNFRVTFKEPFAPVLQSFSIGILPRHLLEGKDINTAEFNTKPVGTGRFIFREWKSDVHVIVDRNEGYYGQVPYLDSIVFKIVPDTTVMMEELAAGAVDVSGIPAAHYQRMLGVESLNVHVYPGLYFNYFGWNERLPKFNDVRVRNALTLALDRDEIAVAAFEGLSIPATGPFPPVSWAVNPAINPLTRDVARARHLLQEAGWRDTNGDGWLDRNGETFEFEFLALAGDPSTKIVVELAMEYYKEVGVKLNPLFLEWGDFVTRLDPPARAFEGFFLGFSVGLDPDPHIFYHSSEAEWGFNDTAFSDALVDALIEEGRRTLDFGERQRVYWQLHEQLHLTQPVTFMFFRNDILGVNKRFQGVVPSPIGPIWNVEYWWVPRNLQRY